MPSFVPIGGLHHFAYRCRDAEETRHFYEDILGLPLGGVITQDRVPSTQEFAPHAHIFFQMTDGSCIAFFDLGDGKAAEPSSNTAPWVNHLALRVDSLGELETAMAKLRAAGVDVLGITDHGQIKSIYFFDPNGIRLEFNRAGVIGAALSRLRTECPRTASRMAAEKAAGSRRIGRPLGCAT